MIKILLALLILIIAVTVFIFWATQKNNLIYNHTHGILEYDISKREVRETIKIATYNMGYASGMLNNKGMKYDRSFIENNLKDIIQTLSNYDFDILVLQEIDFDADRSFNIDQLDYLAKNLGYQYAAYQVNWNVKYLPWPGLFPSKHFKKIISGQVVLSQFPIKKSEVKIFDKPGSNPFWYNLFYLDRSMQMISITHPKREINLWHTHLEAFDAFTRKKQFDVMRELLKSSEDQIDFILGDLNSLSYRCEKSLFSNLDDGFMDFIENTKFLNAELEFNSPDFRCTYPSDDPSEKIDHILYHPKINLIDQGVIELNASDHLPVWAEFKL